MVAFFFCLRRLKYLGARVFELFYCRNLPFELSCSLVWRRECWLLIKVCFFLYSHLHDVHCRKYRNWVNWNVSVTVNRMLLPSKYSERWKNEYNMLFSPPVFKTELFVLNFLMMREYFWSFLFFKVLFLVFDENLTFNFVSSQCTTKMASMVFKRTVFENRRKPKGLLRPKMKNNLKDVAQVLLLNQINEISISH